MLQEVVARTLGVELGSYQQFVGSLHLYDRDGVKARQYIDEGFQSTLPMPAMPSGDPWPSIKALLDVEARIRSGEKIDASACGVSEYWADLIRLLQIFEATDDHRKIEVLRATDNTEALIDAVGLACGAAFVTPARVSSEDPR
jgi:thymidylate synthase